MKISIFGDSILEGVRLENGKYTRGHALMSCFEAEHGVTLDNKSKFGSTIDKGLVRLRRAAEGGSLGSYTVLEFGGNDSAYRWDEVAARPEDEHVCATPPEKFREIYREMIDLVYKNGSWPIVCTLPPISSRLYLDHVTRGGIDKAAILRWLGDIEAISRWQEGYSRMAAELAKDRGCLLLDLRAPFPPYGEELEACLCADGIHPNLAGQQLIYKQASKEWTEIMAGRNGKMKSNNKRGYIVSLCFLVLLLGVTFIVFRDKLPDIMNAVAQIPAATVAVILGCGLAYQLIDSLMCLILVRSRMPSLTYLQAFELTMCGVFGLVCSNSIITVPMQSVYLYSKSLDVGHTVGLMTVKYILHKATVFTFALAMLLLNMQWLRASVPGVMKYLLPGFAVCFLIITLLVLLCTWEWLKKLMLRIIDKLPDNGKLGEKKDGWRESINLMYTEMQNLLSQKWRIAAALALNIVKFTVVYSIPLLALRALGCAELSFIHSLALGSLVWLIAGVLPSVSGLGPTDLAFALLYGAFAGENTVSAALVLYRAATYFTPFAVSLPTVLIGQRRVRRALAEKDGNKTE